MEPEGIVYAATDNAPGFVDLLESEYLQELRTRAEWVMEAFGHIDAATLRSLIAGLGGVENSTTGYYSGPDNRGIS